MDKELILLTLKDKLNDEAIMILSNRNDIDFAKLMLIDFKNPLLGLILGVFFGVLGVDRFYKGDIFLGIVKIFINPLTLGIWWLADLFLVYKGIKNDNFKKILSII